MNSPAKLLVALSVILPISSAAWAYQFHQFPQHSSSMPLWLHSRCIFRATNRLARSNCSRRLSKNTSPSSSRLLGTKAGIPGNPPGDIILENAQDVLPSIDQDRLRSNIEKIRDLIGYPTYDVTLYLVEDEFMQETNRETRGMDKPTDILSFQFHAHKPNQAGVLEDPEFDIPDFYTLGEMLVDVPYVIRQCQEDEAYFASNNSDDEEEDRGVSGAMARIYDPEERINMLLVHGMLHLVGHDHEEDDEFEIMVTKEEEILDKLGLLPPK